MYKNGILVLTIAALMITTVSCTSQQRGSSAEQTSIITASSAQTEVSSTTKANVTTSAKQTDASVSSSQSTTTAPVPTVTQKASEIFTPDANLDAILDKTLNLEEGTAGSSLKQASHAGELLDWAEGTSLKQKGIEAQIAYYFDSLGSASAVDQFMINFTKISNTAQLIINKDAYTLSCISDSGYVMAHDTYTQSKWDTFSMAVQVSADAY